MAKRIVSLKEEMVENVYTMEEIETIMEQEKYFPIEEDDDEEDEEGVLKYSNNRSQIWIKYMRSNTDYLIIDVTLRTKKKGKTPVHALRNTTDIKNMMDYFRDNEKYDEFMILMFGMLLARRIGDILSLKWSDFYYENGSKKETLNTLIEQKTDKIVEISVTNITWDYIDWYCNIKHINPMEHFNEDIFQCAYKDELGDNYTEEEYYEAIRKQSGMFRYEFKKNAEFNGIKEVSTHSLRKTFGYIAHQINKYDPDGLPVLQTIFGHSDIETTKRYIDIMSEKAEKMFNDVGKYISDIDNGVVPIIDNIPAIALKTNDMRDVILFVYNKGRENANITDLNVHMETMNKFLLMVEEMRLA